MSISSIIDRFTFKNRWRQTQGAALWAFDALAGSIFARIQCGADSWESIAHYMFDEELRIEGDRAYLSCTVVNQPAAFLERSNSGVDLVFEWCGAEMVRLPVDGELAADIPSFFANR